MKKLVAALLVMVCGMAVAEEVMATKNGLGGLIALTNRPAKFCQAGHLAAFAEEPMQRGDEPMMILHFGCWFFDEGVIHTYWTEGSRTAFHVRAFKGVTVTDFDVAEDGAPTEVKGKTLAVGEAS